MPRKLLYDKDSDQTLIYDENGELQGFKPGDQSKDTLLQSDSYPLEAAGAAPPMDQNTIPNAMRQASKDFVANAAAEGANFIPGGGVAGALIRLLGAGSLSLGAEKLLNPDKPADAQFGDAAQNAILSRLVPGLMENKISFHPTIRGGVGTFGKMFGMIDPRGIKVLPRTTTVMKSPGRVPAGTEVVIPPEAPPRLPGMPDDWQMGYASTPDKTITRTVQPRVPAGYEVSVPQEPPIPGIEGLPPGAQVRKTGPPVPPKVYKGGQRMPDAQITENIPGKSKAPPPRAYKGGQPLPQVPMDMPIKLSHLKRFAVGTGANTVVDLGPLINDLFGGGEKPPQP